MERARSVVGSHTVGSPTREIRVLSVPSSHVYVRHLSAPHGDDGVVRLPDPPVPGDMPVAQWWPPPALDAEWVRRHRDDFDLCHLHFGFDARDPQDLARWVEALRRAGKPLVYTVHDLRNPHHLDRSLHDAQLDVLVPSADEMVTLTDGAAVEIRRRWGREAHVVPHPHVVDLERMASTRGQLPNYLIGVHLKSLRASMDPLPVLAEMVAELPSLAGARLRVDVHTDVMTPGSTRYDAGVARAVRAWENAGTIELAVHDYFSDAELWDYLQGLDLSVLPYRFGTHSGWMEACYDLGTAVLAPSCGYYAHQRPCLVYGHDESGGLDRAGLRAALRRAVDERPRWRAVPLVRMRERQAVARLHEQIYRNVLGGVR